MTPGTTGGHSSCITSLCHADAFCGPQLRSGCIFSLAPNIGFVLTDCDSCLNALLEPSTESETHSCWCSLLRAAHAIISQGLAPLGDMGLNCLASGQNKSFLSFTSSYFPSSSLVCLKGHHRGRACRDLAGQQNNMMQRILRPNQREQTAEENRVKSHKQQQMRSRCGVRNNTDCTPSETNMMRSKDDGHQTAGFTPSPHCLNMN